MAAQRLVIPALPGWPQPPEPVWFEVEGARQPLRLTADLLAGSHLLPAMYLGRDLVLPASLDPALLEQLPGAVALLAHWFAPLQPINLRTSTACRVNGLAEVPEDLPPGRGIGCFFTGGVDSFRTLQRHLDRIDTLVFVIGFDVHEDDPNLWRQTGEMLDTVAADTGKHLIVVRTNLRQHTDRLVPWDLAHGTALAAVARLLAPELEEIMIASTFADHQLIPWGSHPALDRHWSTDRQRFTHDGSDEARGQKLRHLLDWPLARRWLRVCTGDTGDTYNCGRCSKCLPTMTALELLDASGKMTTLPGALDLALLEGLEIRGVAEVPFMEELLERALAGGESKAPLAAMLDKVLKRPGLPAGHAPRHLGLHPPPPLQVDLESFEADDHGWEWQLRLRWGAEEHLLRVHLSAPEFPPQPGDIADAAFIWLVPLAMHLGVPLDFGQTLPVDKELLDRMVEGQSLLDAMPPGQLRSVPLNMPTRPSGGQPVGRVLASAFSGGVDAHTLAASSVPRPGVLVYVHGIDSTTDTAARRTKLKHQAARAVACHGAPLAFVATNLRALLTGRFGLRWGVVFRMGIHGSGHLLASHINTFCIASDYTFDALTRDYTTMVDHGYSIFEFNHPLLSELSTSSRVRQEYWDDGRKRPMRLEVVAGVPGALATLAVCQEEAKGRYTGDQPNCGRCEKCLRTMCMLAALGRHNDLGAFAQPLEPEALAAMPPLPTIGAYTAWQTALRQLKASTKAPPDIVRQVQRVIERSSRPEWNDAGRITDPALLRDLRRHRDFPRWLTKEGSPLARAVFADKPGRRALQWLAHPLGWKKFRMVALDRLAAGQPDKIRRWMRRANALRMFKKDP